MKGKYQSINIVILITILTTSLYVVSNNLPMLVGSFRYFWAPLTLLLLLIIKPIVFFKKPMKQLLIYGILVVGVFPYILWEHLSEWNKSLIMEEFYALVVFVAIFNYYYVRRDFDGLGLLGKFSFYFVLLTILTTNIALYFDPNVVRQSASPSSFSSFQAQLFKQTGAAGYGYVQALVLLIPILVYLIKYQQKFIFSTRILTLIVLLILITIIRAQFFANVLAAFVILSFSLAGAKRAKKSFLPVALITLVLILIPTSFYTQQLLSISSYFSPDSNIYFKINDLAYFIQNPEFESTTAAGSRASRYPLLFEAFIANPILGDASYSSPFKIDLGGHLYWMNKLTIFGIIGFSFFIYMFYTIYKTIRKLLDDSFGFYYFLSVSAFVLLGLMKNIGGRESFLMLIIIIPGLYFLQLTKDKKL